MRTPINACCIGGPASENAPVSAQALLIITGIYAALGLAVFAITLAFY